MACSARRYLWGWTLSARCLLSVFVLLSAGILASKSSRQIPGPAIDATLEIDPNTAPPAVLSALPRLGPALVGRIVAERDRKPFDSLDDFDTRVRGIGPVTAAALRPYFRFGVDDPIATPQPPLAPLASREP